VATTVSMRVRNTASPEEQEQAILDAALREFADAGIRRVNVDHVARSAGVSRSTLYRRFPNKEALLIAVLQIWAAGVLLRLFTVTEGHDARGALIEAFTESSRILTTDPLAHRLFITDGEISAVAALNATLDPLFMREAVAAIAGVLRNAGATMPDDELHMVVELSSRIAHSLLQFRSHQVDVTNPKDVREFAARYVAPMVY
jgi:TetR/AcrR family transcriptional regulator